jgi:hypothetical protein
MTTVVAAPSEYPAPLRRQRWRVKNNKRRSVKILYIGDREDADYAFRPAALCALFVDGKQMLSSRWIFCRDFERAANKYIYLGRDEASAL